MENYENLFQGVLMGPDSELSDKLDADGMDFSFRPMTEGLGFHQEAFIQPSSTPSHSQKYSPARDPLPSMNIDFPVQTPSSGHVSRNLPNWDGRVVRENRENRDNREFREKLVQAKPAVREEAKMEERVLAALLDFFLITMLEAGLLALFYFSARLTLGPGHSMDFSQILVQNKSLWPLLLLLFCPLALLYFSLLDSYHGNSVGKYLSKIQLAREDGGAVKIQDSFLRAVFVVFCLPLAGLPLLKNIQGNYSQTLIIKRK